jgi:hypothetical protein
MPPARDRCFLFVSFSSWLPVVRPAQSASAAAPRRCVSAPCLRRQCPAGVASAIGSPHLLRQATPGAAPAVLNKSLNTLYPPPLCSFTRLGQRRRARGFDPRAFFCASGANFRALRRLGFPLRLRIARRLPFVSMSAGSLLRMVDKALAGPKAGQGFFCPKPRHRAATNFLFWFGNHATISRRVIARISTDRSARLAG